MISSKHFNGKILIHFSKIMECSLYLYALLDVHVRAISLTPQSVLPPIHGFLYLSQHSHDDFIVIFHHERIEEGISFVGLALQLMAE